MLGPDREGRVDPRSERGEVPISVILLIAAAAALAYAILGATITDPDSFGDVPIPSQTSLELPGREAEISLALPSASRSSATPPPGDLEITVRDTAGQYLRVDARGGEPYEQEGLTVRPVAAVFPPAEGSYLVDVQGQESSAAGGRLLIGEGPIGSIGARFERLGELVTGPFGVLAGALLLLAVLLPPFRRALGRRP